MCHSQFYQKMLADRSAYYQENILKTLRAYRRDASLSRLQAVRSTLLELKKQLSCKQSHALNAAEQSKAPS